MNNETLKALAEAPQPSTYLHIENAQLKQRIAQAEAVINQRAVQTLNDFMNGLNFMVGLAQTGDQGAQQMIKMLRDVLERAEQQASPITVIRA